MYVEVAVQCKEYGYGSDTIVGDVSEEFYDCKTSIFKIWIIRSWRWK